MVRKKEKGNPGIVHIVGGAALLLAALLINVVAPVLYQWHCPISAGLYGSGPCTFGDSLLFTIVLLVLAAASVITGLILIGIGIYRNTRSK